MIPLLSQFPHSTLESTAVTPESQVADKLRAIGDRIQEEYQLDLNQAVDDLLQMEGNGQLTFNALQSTALELLNNVSPGWSQVGNSSSFVCHGSPLPVISTPPLTLYSFLYSSHISLHNPNKFLSSGELALLIAFSHMPHCL